MAAQPLPPTKKKKVPNFNFRYFPNDGVFEKVDKSIFMPKNIGFPFYADLTGLNSTSIALKLEMPIK